MECAFDIAVLGRATPEVASQASAKALAAPFKANGITELD